MGEGQGGDEGGKQKWCVGDLLADKRCSPAVLDFFRSTHVGRTAPPVEENWDSGDEEEEVGTDEPPDEVGEQEEWLPISGFICNFLDAGSASFFCLFFPWCDFSAPFRSAEGARVLPSSPSFGAGWQTRSG